LIVGQLAFISKHLVPAIGGDLREIGF